MNITRIPPIEELEINCTKILQCSDPALLERQLLWVLKYHKLINYSFSYSSVFWRARICESLNGFSAVQEMAAPPPDKTKSGRLNQINNPVLYVSPNQFAALAEVRAEAGDIVQLASFEFKPEQKLVCGLLGELTQIHRWGRGFTSDKVDEALNSLLLQTEFKAACSMVYIDTFLSELMLKKDSSSNEYLHSRTLANLLFSDSKTSIDAIVYPSVIMAGARNYAITPSSADRALKCTGSALIRVDQRLSYGMYKFSLIRQASRISSAGEFEWSGS